MFGTMDDSRRLLEIEDRLGEMTYALAGLRARGDRALHYLRKELEEMVAECTEQRDGWVAATARAEALLAGLEAEAGDV
ncbi:MAG: hypothetical protein ACYC5Q_11715 [Thermoleophilia bacterium]